MTLLKVNEEKFKWPYQQPQELTARFTVELDFAVPFLKTYPNSVMRWVPINSIPYLPERKEQLRARLLWGAGLWIKKEEHSKSRWHLVTPEGDILVAGPYHAYKYVDPKSPSGLVAVGLASYQVQDPSACDFRLKAKFIPEYGRYLDLGPERPEWTVKTDGPNLNSTEDPSGGKMTIRQLGRGGE